MPGTKAPPGETAGRDLSAESLAHEMKTPLAALSAAAGNLRRQVARILAARSGGGAEAVPGPILRLAAEALGRPAPEPATGPGAERRVAAVGAALRAAGVAGDVDTAARRLVMSGWEGDLGAVAPHLGSPADGEALSLLEDAGRLRAALRSMDLSVERLLAIARAAGGGSAGEPSGALECARSAVEILAHAIPPGVAVEILSEDDGVVASPFKVQQVLTNLVRNAVEAVPVEGGSVTIACAAEGGRVRFRVTDNGPGIPPGLRGRLFTPFAKGARGGAGLGLWLSRRLAEEMGGRLEEAPEPPGGFDLDLPAAGRAAAGRGGGR